MEVVNAGGLVQSHADGGRAGGATPDDGPAEPPSGQGRNRAGPSRLAPSCHLSRPRSVLPLLRRRRLLAGRLFPAQRGSLTSSTKISHRDDVVRRRPLSYDTRSSAIAEGPLDALCQLKSCQLRSNSAETTGVVCVILRLAVLVEHRLVTDTDRQTDTGPCLVPRMRSIAR